MTNPSNVLGSIAGKYLTFAIGKERYGLEILKVQEIIGITRITSVPKCPPYVKGVINLRGKIIPVVDLRIKFGFPPIPYNDQTCIIVVHIKIGEQKVAIGAIVDTVLEVINFSNEQLESVPDYGQSIDSDFVIAMGKKDEILSILIDIEKVIGDFDLAHLHKDGQSEVQSQEA